MEATEHLTWVDAWCRRCGLRHGDETCQGELLATGPERHGWRVLVDTNDGPLVYGTLVAPAAGAWRARILTYPNVLWVLPWGGTMKFTGSTPAEAEQAAIEFIKEFCDRRNWQVRKEVPSVESGEVDREQDETIADSDIVRASQRSVHALLLRYGVDQATNRGETDDLSEGGLFIHTDDPLAPGTRLHVRLDLDGFGISLRGVVRWARERPEEGRLPGMGIKLLNPHPRYLHYVRQKQKASTTEIEPWEDQFE